VVRYLAVKIEYYERETLVESSSTFASQSRRVHNGLLLIYLRAPSLHFSSSFRPSSCYLRPCRDVGWYTRDREERGAVGERRARQSHARIPRTPRTARIPEAPRGKSTLLPRPSFFLSRISRKVFARER